LTAKRISFGVNPVDTAKKLIIGQYRIMVDKTNEEYVFWG
jgi:hypothetical protein